MNARKWFVFLLSVLLILPILAVPASAAEDPVLSYELYVDGLEVKEVETGDIITITLYLQRTDSDAPYTMYAMQSEIRYDSAFFELVEDSVYLYDGVNSTDIAVGGTLREFYMNFVSLSGGVEWQARTRVGSFQLRVIATEGVSTITNEDFLVSKPDGSGGYECSSNALTVIVTADCTVKFETNGGSKLDPITAIYGETIPRPEDPIREGKRFVGWYRDIHLTQEWDFDTDTVQGNMTLYAKWEDVPETVPTEPSSEAPTEPAGTDESTEPNEPVEPDDRDPGYLAVIMLVGLLGLFLLILLWKRSFVRYSLKTGDIALNYKDDEHDVQVEVVLYDGEKEYRLNKSRTVKAKQRLRYIRNVSNLPIADIKPGTYKGELVITDGSYLKVKKCRIKALDRELKES